MTIIKWLYERFGGSITYVKRNLSKKPFATWSIHAKSLYPILTFVVDFLINKKEVCNELINFQKTILKNGGKRSSEIFKEEFKVICRERDKIIERVHFLNRKGK